MEDIVRVWDEVIQFTNLGVDITVYGKYVEDGFIYYLSSMSIQKTNAGTMATLVGIERDGELKPIADINTPAAGVAVGEWYYTALLIPGDRIYITAAAGTSGTVITAQIRGLKIRREDFASGKIIPGGF